MSSTYEDLMVVPTLATEQPEAEAEVTESTEAAVATSAPAHDSSGPAARLLEIAARNADQLLNEAQAEADEMKASARDEADEVLTEARTEAERVRAELENTGVAGADNESGENLDGGRIGVGAEIGIPTFGLGSAAFLKTEYRYSNYEQGFEKHTGVVGVGFRVVVI